MILSVTHPCISLVSSGQHFPECDGSVLEFHMFPEEGLGDSAVFERFGSAISTSDRRLTECLPTTMPAGVLA